MTDQLATAADYHAAVKAFWAGRDLQTQKQIESGNVDAGTRGSATGGKHLNALQDLIASQFEPLCDLGATIRRNGIIPLPGFYRRTKEWDVVVTYKDTLVAAIECKSQVGSVGNNFNNRTEEAIGSATDLRQAHKAGWTGMATPWLGFAMIFEYTTDANKPVKDRGRAVYDPDPTFNNSSYRTRYEILFRRLVHERVYDAACFITSKRGEGIYDEPVPELSTGNLTAAIAGRVTYIKTLRETGTSPEDKPTLL